MIHDKTIAKYESVADFYKKLYSEYRFLPLKVRIKIRLNTDPSLLTKDGRAIVMARELEKIGSPMASDLYRFAEAFCTDEMAKYLYHINVYDLNLLISAKDKEFWINNFPTYGNKIESKIISKIEELTILSGYTKEDLVSWANVLNVCDNIELNSNTGFTKFDKKLALFERTVSEDLNEVILKNFNYNNVGIFYLTNSLIDSVYSLLEWIPKAKSYDEVFETKILEEAIPEITNVVSTITKALYIIANKKGHLNDQECEDLKDTVQIAMNKFKKSSVIKKTGLEITEKTASCIAEYKDRRN